MANSVSCLSNAIPFSKLSNAKSKCCGPFTYDYFAIFPEFGIMRPAGSGRGRRVKAMAVDRRDNLDHLQRPGNRRRDAPSGSWNRFPSARTIQQMMDTMERIVEDPLAFTTTWPSPNPNNGDGYMRGRTPWEIKEGDTDYKMRFDIPGMTKQDIKVWVEEKMLVIKAEKVPQRKDSHYNGGVEDEGDWSPKSYGRYYSRIALPENVEFEKIKAEVRDGVLYIMIPKASSTTKIFDVNVE